MGRHATEHIRHYHETLVGQHKFVGGTVLEGYGLRTRVFDWSQGEVYYAWGADYTPLTSIFPWIDRLLLGKRYDEELGIAGTATSDAWLSIARCAGRNTEVTQFEYGPGFGKLLAPYIAVAEHKLDVPFDEIEVDHIRGGLGFWRGILPNLPQTTTDPEYSEWLAAALQSAASFIIAESDC